MLAQCWADVVHADLALSQNYVIMLRWFLISQISLETNARRSANVVLMLLQRRRR